MAQVSHATAAHNKEVFAAVFSQSNIRPPTQRKQFEHKPSLSLENVRIQMLEDGRNLLGIGLEDYDHTFSRITSFHPNFLLNKVDPATLTANNFNQSVFSNTISKSQSWKFLLSWKTDFGSARMEKVFASIIDRLISDFVVWSYSGVRTDSVLSHLECWIDHMIWPYACVILNRLYDVVSPTSASVLDRNHLQRWKDMGITRLADLRITELFDIVVDWDSTASAIDDLKHFVTNTATRGYLTTDFAGTLTRRLLQPGASTIEILQVYISIIKAFRRLDAKGVLLERVARRIRRYLRERDDTIRVVVAGLLADVSEDSTPVDADVLSELPVELQQRDPNKGRGSDGDLDWNNMEWMPDPVDAAPDYLKSKNTDVIGSLISLFESKDVFVKELQTVLADRLLKNKADFDQEISVVEHLKIRFGDAVLQGCEVMLRDVLDSRKVDQVIRKDQRVDDDDDDDKAKTSDHQPEMHTKILSRLFWPSLQEQTFNVPAPIMEQQARYEKGFESLKQSRKLTWLNAIGQVEVQLDLEDRTFNEEVLPWQASVIYAFQDQSAHSISSLETLLEMTPTLIRSACMFWSSKRILTAVPGEKDTFTVLETLPQHIETENQNISSTDSNVNANANTNAASEAAAAAAAAIAAEQAATQAARELEETQRRQKMTMYHQFIISMLTNQGAMPLPRIAMMLGIVVPGGFPFGNEELKEFMQGMVKEGVLEIGAGGAYKISS